MNPLKQLETCGQAPWLDYLLRSYVANGELKTLIDRDGLKGVTSNPSIFQKAIGETEDYQDALKGFLSGSDHSVADIYESLAVEDIRAAADVLDTVYAATGGRDGYVSLECSPYVAEDTEATIAEALHLWKMVGRKNLMVKVPGTPAGVPAVRRLIAEGLNINITLLFSVSAYESVVEAYIAGLEDRLAAGEDVSTAASVASFFVSRIDAAVDKRLDASGDPRAAGLKGAVAIANAKIAYQRYKALFSGPRWERLAAAGAKTQRLLWASTSTKNPAYRDTLYVEALIGRDTVDTIPPATMDAFRDHGEVVTDAIEADLEGAQETLKALDALGISLSDITEELVKDGVSQFEDAFDKLFSSVAAHRRAIVDGEAGAVNWSAGEDLTALFKAGLEDWRAGGKVRRLWRSDASLWTGSDEGRWGGWLTIADQELKDVGALESFAQSVRTAGFSDVLLLGMGGSSLGPEVLSETFEPQSGWPRFHMLDSTDPAQIRSVEARLDIARTLFIVSSKSGSTLEPNIFMDYFYDRAKTALGEAAAGAHFVAVTDPGSSLESHAKSRGFREVFFGLPSIGGRYSVLSRFGLVPAAAMGLDLRALLSAARSMQFACGPDVPPDQNPGVQLGLLMGLAASRLGRDKVTIIASPAIADLGSWLEQLLAESTGKQGRGLIPVAGEPLGAPESYGQDRFFAYLALAGEVDPDQEKGVAALEAAGFPVARLVLRTRDDIARQFFCWEMATAVAGAVIGINPFDQPDVEDSKTKTRALTDAYEKSGSLATDTPIFVQGELELYADARDAQTLGSHLQTADYLRAWLQQVGPGDYLAILAYIERSPAHVEALTTLRVRWRDRLRAATCLGFGPRFQHSTGQAYKGGPNSGVFLQITSADSADLEVPGRRLTFGVVKAAQAAGDLGVLQDRGRRALRVHLKSPDAGLSQLCAAFETALA